LAIGDSAQSGLPEPGMVMRGKVGGRRLLDETDSNIGRGDLLINF
jgi:hypothetical protein